MRTLTIVTGAICLLSALNASAVSGIAVTNKCASSTTQGNGTGSIWKFVVNNNVAGSGAQIYSGNDAGCVRINQSGTKVAFCRSNGDICMIDVNGGPVTVLTNAGGFSWVDFPEDEWVYFTKSGYWYRVSTSGAKTVQSNVLKTPGGTTQSIARGGKRGAGHVWNVCGTNGASAYGDVNFCKSGCGVGISVSGRYVTRNLPTHADLEIYDLNKGGSLAHTIKAKNFGHVSSENWNVNGFSANSDEWLCFKQGNGYLQDKSSRQVLYKVDGSEAIEIQKPVDGVFYEGGDFWVGTPGAVGALSQSSQFIREQFRLDIGSREIRCKGIADGISVSVLTVGGRVIKKLPAGSDVTAFRFMVNPGSYLVRVSGDRGMQTRLVTVGN
jgi:hypothetical protein